MTEHRRVTASSAAASASPPPPWAAAASGGGGGCLSDTGADGRGPGLGTEPEEAPRPPLDGVGLHSHSNGYGSDTEEGVYSERRRGAEEPHHGLQVDITTPRIAHSIPNQLDAAFCAEP